MSKKKYDSDSLWIDRRSRLPFANSSNKSKEFVSLNFLLSGLLHRIQTIRFRAYVGIILVLLKVTNEYFACFRSCINPNRHGSQVFSVIE